MVYTEVSIVAPDRALIDEDVRLQITIKNISGGTINAVPGFLSIDSVNVTPFYMEDLRWLSPSQSYTWVRNFTMPGKDVTVHVESWWENSYALHKDNEVNVDVLLELVSEFASFAIGSYEGLLTK